MAHLEGEQRVQQSILVINGPGAFQGISAQLIESACTDLCKELDVKLDFRQAANEEDLHNWIAQTADEVDGLILNPAGCSRLGAVDFGSLKKPVVEVHLHNIYQEGEESVRPLHNRGAKIGFICGLGADGYLLAIRSLAQSFNNKGR